MGLMRPMGLIGLMGLASPMSPISPIGPIHDYPKYFRRKSCHECSKFYPFDLRSGSGRRFEYERVGFDGLSLRLRAGRVLGLSGHLPRPSSVAHPVDVGDQRHLGDLGGRLDPD